MYIKLDKKTGKYHTEYNGLTYDLQKASIFGSGLVAIPKDTLFLSVRQVVKDVVKILSTCCSPQPFVIINPQGKFLTETVEVVTDLQKAAVWDSAFNYTGPYNILYVSVDYKLELV
jgi:hypothetical protein